MKSQYEQNVMLESTKAQMGVPVIKECTKKAHSGTFKMDSNG